MEISSMNLLDLTYPGPEVIRLNKMASYRPNLPWPRAFLGLANANCDKTREQKGKTSGEFVSDSWFG
jgi:hypothetical protein